jgi:hypothetical protein
MKALLPLRSPLARLTRLAAAAVLAAALQAAPASAEPVRVQLQDAAPAEAARELQRALGAPVEIRGGEGKRVTLSLLAAGSARALDQVASQLGGTWKMKLQVKPGKRENLRPSPPLDHSMALGVQDVPASRAFALVARELRAELELEGDVEARVGLIAVNVSASVILDRLAEQAGVTWDVSYLIDAPNAPVPVPVQPRKKDPSEVPPAPSPAPVTPPAPVVVPAGPAAAQLRAALWEGIKRIVRAEPARRTEVVREFLQQGEAMLQSLNALSPTERAERLRVLSTVLPPWKKLYQGLAPSVRGDLTPVTELLERFFTTKAPGQ